MRLEKSFDQRAEEVDEELPQDDPLKGRFFTIEDRCEGLKVWQNPINKFTIARLHYTADPRKRNSEWKAQARAGLTWAEWMREYEIKWSSFDGVPVYGDDFSTSFHTSREPLVWASLHPVVRGWDFGLGAGGMACVWTQLLTNSRLFVYKELVAGDTDLEHFIPEVKRKSLEWFPQCQKYFDVLDRTSINRGQLDKRSCYLLVRESFPGSEVVLGEHSQLKRRRAVSGFLQANVKGLAKISIDSQGCPMLVGGFEGGYHYPYAKDGQLKDEPMKNEYSHPHDALQVVASRIATLNLTSRNVITIQNPSYGFGSPRPRLTA